MTLNFSKTTAALALATAMTLPFASGASAQIVDPRVIQLEEQIRSLNGQVEELNFQMLQMQDQMRRIQEDNEFRLQQLEDSQQGSIGPVDTGTDLAQATPVAPAAPKEDRVQLTGEPERTLGSLTVDQSGAVIGSELDFTKPVVDGAATASVTLTGTPEEIYSTGYSHVLNGDYGLAEAVFASFVDTFPADPLAADAKFWLGESILAQGRFEDAAEVFIDARAQHPNAEKAPETMFKIGKIMAALGNRDVACATFDDALATYDTMPVNTRNAITNERQSARC